MDQVWGILCASFLEVQQALAFKIVTRDEAAWRHRFRGRHCDE
ncbi:hypothetical protein SAHL_05045 [Salinisphaera orenii YIM 95161]|uniref:Uncharacterized protein n=1 Tax=Salinisphaera orenii YIM 95161 TaxID=1051139 RepID=A0A423Q1Y1_9GAMM|nr:hypothetical protein SAHL_05045 [Salinisphaera halophila YIM 95161]